LRDVAGAADALGDAAVIEPPVTRYADCAGLSIAYQVFGKGELDLVFVPGGVSHVDITWQDRRYQRMMERLASFARVTVFDKRGMGASDPVPRPPTLQERVEDIQTVMDTVGIGNAAVLGFSEGGTAAAAFAGTFPKRVRALLLCGTFPGGVGITDPEPDYPVDVMRDFWRKTIEPWKARMGQGVMIELFAPDLARNEQAVAAMAAFERSATTPAMWRAMLDSMRDLDVRPFLPRISAPTLVIHHRREIVPIEGARYIARHVPGARIVELDGNDHVPWLGDMDSFVDEVEQFLTGVRPRRAERRLATVLFTDIVGSTEQAARLGDRRWRILLEDHQHGSRELVERFGGRLVKTLGDGTLALFDGPAGAVECAREAVRRAGQLGIEIRAGIHAGECELMGDDVGGIAVHVGARIAALAAPGEVLVSSTVKDLVVGSELSFADRGSHELKGVPAEWRLYRVT
jgi:pimeloyl-ACP methyl ester carboxylesterase